MVEIFIFTLGCFYYLVCLGAAITLVDSDSNDSIGEIILKTIITAFLPVVCAIFIPILIGALLSRRIKNECYYKHD